MAALNNNFNGLAQLRREFRSGKVSKDDVEIECRILKEQRGILNMWIKIQALNGPIGKIKKAAIRENIIGDGSAFSYDTVDSENELIKCPGLDDSLIKRSECLDYSGENKFEECSGCEIGLITKKLLLKNAKLPRIPLKNKIL